MADESEEKPSGHAYAGIRVLEFGQVLAAPYAAMMLADLGGDVIKVEPLGGDASRSYTPPDVGGESAYYLSVNRNKRGISLDLKSDAGRDAALALVAKADVVIENSRAGVMDRLGLGYAAMKAINPGIIYCAISGYGRTGPFAERAGYDPIMQAESGLMSMSGERDGPPVRVGISVVDMVTGMFAAQAISAALYARKESGEGQMIEANLFGSAANMLVNFGAQSLLTGDDPRRAGNGSQAAQPAGVYTSADGEFMLTIGNEAMYQRFCARVLERPDLGTDPRFATNRDRVDHMAELTDVLNAVFGTRPNKVWLDRMLEHGIPAGEILGVREALASPMAQAVNLVGSAPHTTLGDLPTLMPSYSLSGTPVRDPVAAPLIGEHTRDVMREVAGWDEARIDAMIVAGQARAWEDGA